jgi:hypothetical protein
MPFGCLSVFVTWLNLITISPSSQAATADDALNANVMDSAVLSRNFIFPPLNRCCRTSEFFSGTAYVGEITGVSPED